ncbi:MAG: hypothetical protein GX448_02200 [Planctomycetes bacterium]|nr:hypothetical protein [Planctomycetota bacterium]
MSIRSRVEDALLLYRSGRHEGGLPVDVQFMDTEQLSVRAGGAPEYVLEVSHGWFHWLIRSVVEAPCNAAEFALPSPAEKEPD